MFDLVDTDRSEFITRDELAQLCSSQAGNFSTSLLDSVMASLDADNDGQISFEEFKAGFNVSSYHSPRSSTPSLSLSLSVCPFVHLFHLYTSLAD